MELKEGFKNTEIGVIPNDWEVKKIGELSKLKNGYAFSSDFFSKTGPIVITPGNFKLEGGLKFNDRNTLRYSGHVSKEMQFQNGDLLIVMTDLTPDCNLLGKPGIVNSEDVILHNQRIGKITVTNNLINQEYLYWFFVSELFSRRMKETATGSTVRHTSVGSINNSLIAIPTKAEQTAIAKALSDADALISGLEKLIAKKRNIKQGAMQKLLQPKEGWEVKNLGEVAFVNMGQSPLSSYYNSEGIGLPLVQGNADVENRKTIIRFYTSMITKRGKVGDIIMSVRAPVGEISKATFDCCLGRGVCSISFDNEYLYHYLIYFEKSWEKLSTGSTFDSVNSKQVKELEIPIPKSKEEQNEIAAILSDMDTEITALETKLEKYKKVKLGMMQNLLTGKIRLI